MREYYNHPLAYGMPSLEQPQYHPGNHISIQYPTSSHPGPSCPLAPAYVSPSLSESSYTDYLAANEYEIEDNSDLQSNSYYTSEGQSHQGGSFISCIDSTITSEEHNNQAARNERNLAIAGYGVTFTGVDPPYYGPYHDTSPEAIQGTDFSSNGYASIGSRFQSDGMQSFGLNLFTDPLLCQELSTDIHHGLDGTAASQNGSEYHLLSLNPNSSTDGCVPSALLALRDYEKSLCCHVSVPVPHTDQAVTPSNATTWIPSGMNCFGTGPSIASNTSPSVTSVETNQLDYPSNSRRPCYIASSRGTITHTSLVGPVASLGYVGNGTSPGFIPVTQVSSSISTSPPFSQGTAPSLGSLKIIKSRNPQEIHNYGHGESLDAEPLKTCSSESAASVAKPELEHGLSNCPWKGCSTTTKGKHHRSNMRNHVRTKHEKPAPPMCELCGVKFEKNDRLKRHLKAKTKHKLPFEQLGKTVRKTRANGTPYTTCQQVHDYANEGAGETCHNERVWSIITHESVLRMKSEMDSV